MRKLVVGLIALAALLVVMFALIPASTMASSLGDVPGLVFVAGLSPGVIVTFANNGIFNALNDSMTTIVISVVAVALTVGGMARDHPFISNTRFGWASGRWSGSGRFRRLTPSLGRNHFVGLFG